VRLANDSPYGLGSSVFTRDTARGEAIARRIEAGCLERQRRDDQLHGAGAADGGAKASGLGSRHGAVGSAKYCSQQAIVVTKLAMKKELFMYPYKSRTSRMLAGCLKLLYGRASATDRSQAHERGFGVLGVMLQAARNASTTRARRTGRRHSARARRERRCARSRDCRHGRWSSLV